MKVLFASNPRSIASWLIRIFTFSKFSHVGVLLDDGTVIDSTYKTGVRRITEKEFLKHYKVQYLAIPVPDRQAGMDFLISQVGKPYDKTALFGMVLQRNWSDEDSWFCSELLEAALLKAGRKRFRDSVSRIVPQQSWAVL